MKLKNEHSRKLLSRNASGRIEFCEECNVVELEIGAFSIRLHAQDLAILNHLIREADFNLNFHQLEKAKTEASVASSGMH